MVAADHAITTAIDKEDVIKRAVTFVVRNFALDFKRRDLDTAAGASSGLVDHTFLEVYGLDPMEWAWMFRTAMAAEVLAAAPVFSVEDVALGSGFSDLNHFTRCFTNLIGMSPNEFRNQSAALLPHEAKSRHPASFQRLVAVQGGAVGHALEKMLTSLKATRAAS